MVNPHSLELTDVKGTGKKLVQHMIRPYKITQCINPMVFHIAIPPTYPMHPIINKEHLKLYRRDKEGKGRAVLEGLRTDLKNIEEYDVDRIVGERYNKSRCRKEYLVWWKGFGPKFDTFEPEINLRNAFKLLGAYKKVQKQKTKDDEGKGRIVQKKIEKEMPEGEEGKLIKI